VNRFVPKDLLASQCFLALKIDRKMTPQHQTGAAFSSTRFAGHLSDTRISRFEQEFAAVGWPGLSELVEDHCGDSNYEQNGD
jgi:hypothetical protein